MKVKQVLIVEKTKELQALWKIQLEGTRVHVHTAHSLAEFDQCVAKLGDLLDLIVWGNSSYEAPDQSVEEAIARVRKQGYTEPMLICTSDTLAQAHQLGAAGPNACAVDKSRVAQAILEVLGLEQPVPEPLPDWTEPFRST